MAEGMEERTEEATPRKRDEAKREGRIPKSQELNTAILLLGSALVFNSVGPTLGGTVLAVFHHGMAVAGSSSLDRASSINLIQSIGWKVAAGLSLFLCSLAGVALSISALQGRGVLSFTPLEPKWERLNPIANGQRMLGVQPWIELAKSLAKVGIVGVAVYATIRSAWEPTLVLSQEAPFAMLGIVRRYAVKILTTAGLAYLALAVVDYGYQMWQHNKSLRMSKQEVKQEAKQNEGDPLIKARLRSMGRALARSQMMREVPNADVVITNPTHIAVALKYDPARADAPVVVAMGQRKVAERIKAIAAEAGVPMIENRPLARALLASSRVGIPIPPELYIAVAEILAFVIRRRGRNSTYGETLA
jgi:flagellar biosynthetic protein FlhB